MEDMLSFVSRRIKNTNSLSMQQLISKMGLSKSKFYRFMQEPWRFSDTDIDTLASILKLDNDDRHTLRMYKSGETEAFDNVEHPNDGTDNEKSEINDYFYNLLFGNDPRQIDYQSKIFTLFGSIDSEPQTGMDKIIKCSASEIASYISSHIIRTTSDEISPFLNIYIFNSINTDKITPLLSLINSIYSIEGLTQNYVLRTKHIINSKNISLLQKVEALANMKNVFDLPGYDIEYLQLDEIGLATLDCFIIEYTDYNNNSRYLFAIFPQMGDTVIYAFDDRNLFEFLTYKCSNILYSQSKVVGDAYNPVSFNKYIAMITSKYEAASINCSLCLDNLVADIWDQMKLRIIEQSNFATYLRSIGDPNGVFSSYSDTQYLDVLFESCKNRFFVNEENETISIVFASGVKAFSDTGYTIETRMFNIRIADDLIIKELEYIKARLGNSFSEKGQKYYILNPSYCANNVYISAFDGYFIWASNDLATRMLNMPFFVNAIYDRDLSSALYSYIHDELIPEDRRKRYDSPLLTDERAAAFIDSLIDEVKERMAKNENQEN